MNKIWMRASAFLLALVISTNIPVQEIMASESSKPDRVTSVSDNAVEGLETDRDSILVKGLETAGNSAPFEERETEEHEPPEDLCEDIEAPQEATDAAAYDVAASPEAENEERQEATVSFCGEDGTAGNPSVSPTWGGELMGLTKAKGRAEDAMAAGAKIPEVIVAVIDTGVNTSHEVFAGRLAGDVYGIEDDNGHGSAVAGIIAQNTPSNVKILALKALNANKEGSIESLTKAIDTAVSERAHIINMSLGISRQDVGEAEYTQYKSLLGDAIRKAREEGCLVVVSAGNSETDIESSGEFPACLDNVITVSAINENKERYGFSNYGEAVDFCAPGDNIYSASIGKGASYQSLSGTSMAAPFISSALAYLKMYNSTISEDDLMRRLRECAEDLGDEGMDPIFGMGLPVFRDGRVSGDEDAIETDEKYVKPVIREAFSTGTSIELTITLPKGEIYDVYRKEEDEEVFSVVTENQVSMSDYKDTFTDNNDVEYGKIYEYYIAAKRKVESEKNYSDIFVKKATIDVKTISIGPLTNTHNKTIYINTDETRQLTAHYSPQNAETDGKFTWSSSNENVVRVDETGFITGISEGWADIRLELTDAGRITTRRVEVSAVSNVIGGSLGEEVTWRIGGEDGDTLIISGNGAMGYAEDYPWANYQEQIRKLVIEDGVTALPDAKSSIYGGVFSSLKQLESADIGSGLTAISICAFRDCTSLKEVFASEGLESIKDGAFSGCSSLQTIMFPDTLTTIGTRAFEKCKALTKIEFPDSVTSIGKWAVSADSIEEFRIPEGVTKADQIFNGKVRNLVISKNLKEYIETEGSYTAVSNYIVEEGSSSFSSEDGVLFNYDKTELRKYPKEREGGYHIPDSVRSIADSAFASCVNLTDVTGGDSLTKVGEKAFYGCTKLTTIQLPDSVETIGREAFSNCSQLTEFVYPASVEICNQCFDGTKLTKVTMPPAVKKMYSTFFGCKYLEDIYIPEGLEEISGDVFSDCALLKMIELPSSLKYFDSYSRSYNIYGFMGGCASVEEFVVPDCATELCSLSFRGCTSLKKITIPAAMKRIDKWACNGGVPLEDVIYKSFTTNWDQITNGSQVVKDAALHIDVSGTFSNGITWHAEGLSGDLTLTISGEGEMPDFASLKDLPWHDGLPEIRHVVIGDGITHVGENAFYNAEVLKDAMIGRDVVSFGRNAFRLCGNLDTFIFAAEDGDNYQVEAQFLVSPCTEEDIEPGVHVTKGANVLEEEIDYTVGYRDNRKPGQALIMITFTGDHAAKRTVFIPFTIASELLKGENIKALSKMILSASTFIYNGNEQTPIVTVKSGRWTLREGIDYRLILSPGRTDTGNYHVKALGTGVYKGEKLELYKITARDITGCEASVSPSSFPYDGTEKKPVLNIPGLLAGKDFTVAYSDNTKIGEATVTASGIGNYTGTLTRTFMIKEAVTEPEDPDPQPGDTEPGTDSTKPGKDGTDPGTDSAKPGAGGHTPRTDDAGSEKGRTRQGTGNDTSGKGATAGISGSGDKGTAVVMPVTDPRNTGNTEEAGTSGTDATDDAAPPAGNKADRPGEDSAASAIEDAARTAADREAVLADKDGTEMWTADSPEGKNGAALTTGAEGSSTYRSLKGIGVVLILLTAAMAAYYVIILMKRKKDKEEET